MAETNWLRYTIQNNIDTSTGGTIIRVKEMGSNSHTVFSARGVRTTVSSTRNDTAARGINSIYFLTNGSISSLTCTDMALSTAFSSGSTITGGVRIFVNNASKVKCSSHGAQLIHLNG